MKIESSSTHCPLTFLLLFGILNATTAQLDKNGRTPIKEFGKLG
jgi:hypothetical protein